MDFYPVHQQVVADPSTHHPPSTPIPTSLATHRPAHHDALPRQLQAGYRGLTDYTPSSAAVTNPSDISAWPHIIDMGNTTHPIDEFHERASPQRPGMVGVPISLGHPIPCPQLQRQHPLSNFSSAALYHPSTSYPSSLASASPSQTQVALANLSIPATEAHQPRSTSTLGGKTAADSEPADAPWNLVPYHLPFTGGAGNNRDQTGGGSSGSPAGPNSSGMFLRSPTPTRRQRTNQACEKCRDRKAKCNGARPTCLRCQNRGLPCEYAKERRMRGPNKNQQSAARQSASVSPSSASYQQLSSNSSSSTATPIHDKSLPSTSSVETQAGEAGSSSSSSHQHRRVATYNDTPHSSISSANHSRPDLHYLTAYHGGPAALAGSRPRAHTASHPLSMQQYSLGHLSQPVASFHHQPSPSTSTELSSGSLSEPPSATDTHFGLDAHLGQTMTATGRYSPSLYGSTDYANMATRMSLQVGEGVYDKSEASALGLSWPQVNGGGSMFTMLSGDGGAEMGAEWFEE